MFGGAGLGQVEGGEGFETGEVGGGGIGDGGLGEGELGEGLEFD